MSDKKAMKDNSSKDEERPRQSPLFQLSKHAAEKIEDNCPECGHGLSFKQGKHGSFIGCDNYPGCDYLRPIGQQTSIENQLIEGSQCGECGAALAVISGRFGLFIGCSRYPDCSYTQKTMEQSAEVNCPKCHQGLLEHRTNRFGKNFYACSAYPKCKYVVNYPPRAQPCPSCHFGILVERKNVSGKRLECPQKACKFKVSL